MVTFSNIPLTVRVPGVYAEFDGSQANQGAGIQPYRVLLITQKLGTGAQTALEPLRVTSAAQASEAFGPGSLGHLMAKTHFLNNAFTETWMVAFDDPGGASAATGAIAFTGPATAAGTLAIYITGRRIQVGVGVGDAATAIATAAATAINQLTDLAVTATPAGSSVNLTARNLGVLGNEIDIRLNYDPTSERTPAGVGFTVTPMSGGAGTVDLDSLWAVLGDEWFNIMVNPYTDATNLASIETEFASREAPPRQIEAHGISAHSGNLGALGTFGSGRNSRQYSVFSVYGSPSPTWDVATAAGAVLAFYGANSPNLPFQGLPLRGILAPAPAARFTWTERNLLLYDGISTTKVDAGGTVLIESAITTYQTNTFGADDTSFLYVNTRLTLGFIRYSLRATFSTKFPRNGLAQDSERVSAATNVVTPSAARAEIMALFRLWESRGMVQGVDQFKRDLVVEINASDKSRLDILLPPELGGQLRVSAFQIQFR